MDKNDVDLARIVFLYNELREKAKELRIVWFGLGWFCGATAALAVYEWMSR